MQMKTDKFFKILIIKLTKTPPRKPFIDGFKYCIKLL